MCMRFLKTILLTGFLLLSADAAVAQERQASPSGESSTQIGESWIIIEYSRPILRGRQGIFGAGEEYGKKVLSGAPVWRTGANQTTKLTTQTALSVGGTTVPAGEYTVFVDLKEGAWTLILSNHKGQAQYKQGEGIWGAYGYDSAKDVVRVPMKTMAIDMSVDQFTIGFSDVSEAGGSIVMYWDNVMAVAPFKVSK